MKDTTSLNEPANRYDVVGAVRLNVSMAQPLLRRVDTAAKSAGFTRSGFIAEAVREKLERQGVITWIGDRSVVSPLLGGGSA